MFTICSKTDIPRTTCLYVWPISSMSKTQATIVRGQISGVIVFPKHLYFFSARDLRYQFIYKMNASYILVVFVGYFLFSGPGKYVLDFIFFYIIICFHRNVYCSILSEWMWTWYLHTTFLLCCMWRYQLRFTRLSW